MKSLALCLACILGSFATNGWADEPAPPPAFPTPHGTSRGHEEIRVTLQAYLDSGAKLVFGQSLVFSFLGWPFGFWVTSQGALIVFCLIVWFYAFAMDRLDHEHSDRARD